MAWFTQDSIDFFRDLELNNDRMWFEKNKKRYEAIVKQPMEAFAEVMVERMREILPDIHMTGKQSVFRIHRDVRFSNDKRPYKTNAGLHINGTGRGDLQSPGLYFHIDPRCTGIGSGLYTVESPALRHLRQYLAANPDEFEKQLADKDFKKYFGDIKGEANKILPPELKGAAARQPLLYNKQFYYWSEHEAEEALRDDLPDFIMEHMRACRKMNEFLSKGRG